MALICRFCFAEAEEKDLIKPCKCSGSQAYVHLQCLRNWQKSVCLNASSQPSQAAQEKRHTTCAVCHSEYSIPPPSREELLEDKVGPGVVGALTSASLLVASEAMSRPPSISGLPQPFQVLFELKHAHWRSSVYLLFGMEAGAEASDGSPSVIAINLTRPLAWEQGTMAAGPEARVARLQQRGEARGVELELHNGGPVNWSRALHALASLSFRPDPHPASGDQGEGEDGLFVLGSGPGPQGDTRWTVLGAVDLVMALAEKEAAIIQAKRAEQAAAKQESLPGGPAASEGGGGRESKWRWAARKLALRLGLPQPKQGQVAAVVTVKVFCGYAKWSRTQLLGEVARGSWGLVPRAHSTLPRLPFRHGKSLWRSFVASPNLQVPKTADVIPDDDDGDVSGSDSSDE